MVEKTIGVTAGARWWPRDGVDVELTADRSWLDNAGHLAGVDERRWAVYLAARLHK